MNQKNGERDGVDQPQGAVHLLSINGMSCASCVSSVEAALAGIEGTNSVAVNFANPSASVVSEASAETQDA